MSTLKGEDLLLKLAYPEVGLLMKNQLCIEIHFRFIMCFIQRIIITCFLKRANTNSCQVSNLHSN